MTKQEVIQRLQKEIERIEKESDDELFCCVVEVDSSQELVEHYLSDELNLDDPNWSMNQQQKEAVINQYYEALNERYCDSVTECVYQVMQELNLTEVFGEV